jgi:hypothetical protein
VTLSTGIWIIWPVRGRQYVRRKAGEKWEKNGRKVGEKWEKSGRKVGETWEKSGRKVGETWEKSGRKVGETWGEGEIEERYLFFVVLYE